MSSQPILKALSVAELCFAAALFLFAIYIALSANGKIDSDSIFGISVFVAGSAIAIFCARALRQRLVLQIASQIIFVVLLIFIYLYLFTGILVYE